MPEILNSSAAISASQDVLDEVMSPGCNLSIWERDVPVSMAKVFSDNLEDVRFTTSLAAIRDQLCTNLDDAGYSDQIERDILIADIEMLARYYSGILDLDELEVRLEIVTTKSCRKWHADYVPARLITTYVGAGTQWLTSDDAARTKNGLDPLTINSMSAGDVGIFKGKLASNVPAIHRSPPITGTGEARLLLVINPAEDD